MFRTGLAIAACCCSFLTFVFVASCASQSVKSNPISTRQIESLSFGMSEADVTKNLGKPNAMFRSDDSYLWVYNTTDGKTQRAAVSFDLNHRLVAKAILPLENEREHNVDYVLKSYFPKVRFRSMDFPSCGRDYISNDAIYVDEANGISIRYSKSQRETDDITWTRPEELKKDMAEILKCQIPKPIQDITN